jgi:hypothetical protein
MQDLPLYFGLGVEHILNWQGYDHILFVMALCGVYAWQDWRKVLVLVTAFTIGHSLTLALSVLNLVLVPVSWIEFLIPVTIVVTSLINMLRQNHGKSSWLFTYGLTLFFGLIHGLGFSNYLKSLLGNDILNQLLAFNVGLEAGQLVIVFFTLTVSFLVLQVLKASRRQWNLLLSTVILVIALTMVIGRFSVLFS